MKQKFFHLCPPPPFLSTFVSALFHLSLLLFTFSLGCTVERHYSVVPEKNQVLQVESGDRWLFDLDEDLKSGCRWLCECDDDDVEVIIDHIAAKAAEPGSPETPGRAEVCVRVHRGYDGPSALKFNYRRTQGRPRTVKSFVITLYKRTGDEAFWK